jgi:hypothetical protein
MVELHGFSKMKQWVPPSQRSPTALRERAAEYKRMALTARTFDIVQKLLKIGTRYERLAVQREHDSDEAGRDIGYGPARAVPMEPVRWH